MSKRLALYSGMYSKINIDDWQISMILQNGLQQLETMVKYIAITL